MIEWIKDGEDVLAIIISADYKPDKTDFITPLDYKQQLGFIVYQGGQAIVPHCHIPMNRSLVGTSEVLFLRSGKAEVDLYTEEKKLHATRVLNQGDMILLVSGGHGFRMQEDTIMVEVKQGPYIGIEEKERF
ncbi:MAG: hypothetical protein A2W23_09605 [Planctomycetes bacterium RBG_16_43_13]|nr:MAG: hypothetical protein A2W23_09605 [Planctomycetes bacterium RBG_16_43_13]